MNEEMMQQLMATAERLATAAESLDRVLGRLDAQQEALDAKVDRMVASVDEGEPEVAQVNNPTIAGTCGGTGEIEQRFEGASLANGAQDASSDGVSHSGEERAEEGARIEKGVLDKTLQSLSVEQRIAVKAELARAGMIE